MTLYYKDGQLLNIHLMLDALRVPTGHYTGVNITVDCADAAAIQASLTDAELQNARLVTYWQHSNINLLHT